MKFVLKTELIAGYYTLELSSTEILDDKIVDKIHKECMRVFNNNVINSLYLGLFHSEKIVKFKIKCSNEDYLLNHLIALSKKFNIEA